MVSFSRAYKIIQGSSINHMVKILGIFDPLPPSWSLLLNNAYVIKWSFGKPPPPQLSTWFMDVFLVHAWRAIMWWASPWFVVYVEISLIHLKPRFCGSRKWLIWIKLSLWAVIYAAHQNTYYKVDFRSKLYELYDILFWF